jgi:hypothetical protein
MLASDRPDRSAPDACRPAGKQLTEPRGVCTAARTRPAAVVRARRAVSRLPRGTRLDDAPRKLDQDVDRLHCIGGVTLRLERFRAASHAA